MEMKNCQHDNLKINRDQGYVFCKDCGERWGGEDDQSPCSYEFYVPEDNYTIVKNPFEWGE